MVEALDYSIQVEVATQVIMVKFILVLINFIKLIFTKFIKWDQSEIIIIVYSIKQEWFVMEWFVVLDKQLLLLKVIDINTTRVINIIELHIKGINILNFGTNNIIVAIIIDTKQYYYHYNIDYDN